MLNALLSRAPLSGQARLGLRQNLSNGQTVTSAEMSGVVVAGGKRSEQPGVDAVG